VNTMRSLRLISSVLICFSIASFAQQSSSPESSTKDAGAILSKASSLVDLRAPGAVPFLMLANVALHEGRKSVDGVFAMAYSGSGQFRTVLRFPNFNSTEILNDGTIYRKRSSEGLPLAIWRLQNLMSISAAYRATSEWKIGGVQTEQIGDVALDCVSALSMSSPFPANFSRISIWARGGPPEAKICVNAATGEPFSIERSSSAYHLESVHERYEFSDYQPFEGKSFPRKLLFHAGNGESIEVQVQKLIRSSAFPADEFVGMAGSTQGKYCELPQTTGELMPSSGNAIPFGSGHFEANIYFRVNAAGGVEYAQVVQSSDPLRDKQFVKWFVGTHFPIRSCGGIAIQYETVVTLISGR